jgi:thiamine biosynthesis protein ThiS
VIFRGQTLLDLIHSLELKPERLAIELNRRIVKPAMWAGTEIPDGSEIEIVHFVGGG